MFCYLFYSFITCFFLLENNLFWAGKGKSLFLYYVPITCLIKFYSLLTIFCITRLLVLTIAMDRETNMAITPHTWRSVCERLSHHWCVNPVFGQSLSSKEALPGLPTSVSYCSALIKVTLDLPLTWTACYVRVVGAVEDSAFLISQELRELSRCEMQQS